ncbi:PQQ-binding-like beta-propeller repeat protein [Streptomyces sp. CC219B]|uniref:outer membrane protein assembly factor BamB family protein n=1 Tax=Streptomyces sp. CC219B TaxID=3044574 RepID=UPI0024A9A1C1|nr:PQQ-binding-like beta-propeller repeat protein [Streptomyces sp. CC219B]
MSQPPSQPPHGGFGAPQDQPPQGGFGAPQTPPPPPAGPPQTPPPAGPPQPGYGYPQQQPTPAPGPYGQPQQPGPYGQPGPYAQQGPYAQPQQPGPYGQPQQPGPYGQPGYGYPQQPGQPGAPGTPPPAPGSRNPFKGKPLLAIGAAVVALLVIGGTVFAVTGGGDDDGGGSKKKPVAGKTDDPKPTATDAPVNPGDGAGDKGDGAEDLNAGRKPGESKVLWYKEAPDAPGSGADAPGLWITDKTAVKAAYKQVFAYDVDGGAPTWDAITFPQKICSATPQKTADDKIVIAYMSGSSDRAKCNQLQELDLNTGEKGWTGEVADGELFDSTLQLQLNIVGKTLMVGRSQSGTAYDVTTGDKLYDKKKYGDACFPAGFTGGEKLISVASCSAGGDNAHDSVQELDPKTGKAKWTWKPDKGWKVERVYSVNPVVVYSTNEDKNAWNISTLGSGGTVTSQVAVDEDFAPECGWAFLGRDLQGCTGVTADSSTLYLPTKATTGANEIVAINLANGKEKWRVKSPLDDSMIPLKVEAGKLIAYVEPGWNSGGQVVSIPTTGTSPKPTKLLQNPEAISKLENSFYSAAYDWVDGRFYLSTTRLSGSDETKEKLMIVYGK